MQNAREHRREHNNNYYRELNRKKISIIKVFNTQHLNNYNSTIIFFRNYENYIASTFRIDF